MRKNRSKVALRRNLAVLTVAIVATSEASFGQTWTGLSGDGMFGTAANWSSAPASGTTTKLTFGGTSNINATNNLGAFTLNSLVFTNSGATVLGADSTSSFNFAGTNPTIVINSGGSVTIAAPVNLGATVNVTGTGSGSLTISGFLADPTVVAAGGNLTSGTGNGLVQSRANTSLTLMGGGTLGYIAASSGTVNFSGGQTYTLASANSPGAGPGLGAPSTTVALSVGNVNGGSAVVNVGSGSTVTGGNMYVGNVAGGTGTLNVNGGTVTSVDNATTYGSYGRFGVYGGTGYINVTNGGVVNCRLFEGGRVDNSKTYVTVSGSGSAVNFEQLLLGRGNNTQSVAILNGGTMTDLGNTGNQIQMAAGTNTNSSMLVSGAGSSINNTLTATFLSTTTNANASMTISNGGTGNFAQLSVGGGGSSAGTANILVDGGTLSGTLLLTGQTGTGVGTGSTSSVTLQNGSTATFTSEALIGDGYLAKSTMTVTGGSTLNLPDFSYNTFIAYGASSNGTLIVSGGSSVPMGSGLVLNVGANSIANTTISGGSTITVAGYLETSYAANTISGITVTGSGSTLDATSSGDPTFIGLGVGSTATMLISNGATGSFSQFSMGGGGTPGGTSILTVDNSTFSATLFLMGQTGTGVGTGSTNTATFTNGAQAVISSEMDLAQGYATLATLNVSGGAIVDNTSSPYSVFASPLPTSTSFINVSSGGQFLATQFQLSTNGGAEGGPATLALSNGGTVTVTGGLFIGNLGTVTLTGGSVLTTGFVNYGTNTSIGHISIDATSTLLIQGTASGGAVMQDVISGSGLLEINSSGLTEYFDVSPFPFKGTIQANLGTFEEIFVPWSPNISNTASGALQATGSGGSFIVATGTGTSFNGVPAQVGLWVHTVQAINGGLVQVSNTAVGSLAHVIVTDTVDVGPSGSYTGLIDLTNNDMIVRQSTLAAVTAQLAAFFGPGGGTVGIGSSEAGQSTSDPRDLIAGLGVIPNDDGTGQPLYTTFDGVTVTTSDILIKYTYLGDTTLKGFVDSTDLANTLAGLNGGLTGWENGDFTYAGSVTEADVLIVLNALANQGTSFGTPGGSGAVPEPTGLVLAAAALPVLGRRRRS
jgi:hypothetical protein